MIPKDRLPGSAYSPVEDLAKANPSSIYNHDGKPITFAQVGEFIDNTYERLISALEPGYNQAIKFAARCQTLTWQEHREETIIGTALTVVAVMALLSILGETPLLRHPVETAYDRFMAKAPKQSEQLVVTEPQTPKAYLVLPNSDIRIPVEEYLVSAQKMLYGSDDKIGHSFIKQVEAKGYKFGQPVNFDVLGNGVPFSAAKGGADRLRLPIDGMGYPPQRVEITPADKEVVIYQTTPVTYPDGKTRIFGLALPWRWFQPYDAISRSISPNMIGTYNVEPSWYNMDRLVPKPGQKSTSQAIEGVKP